MWILQLSTISDCQKSLSIFLWFSICSSHHLGFSKIQNFNSWSAVREHYASTRQISAKSVRRLQRCGDLTVFFKMVAVRHLGFVGRVLGPTMQTDWWSLSERWRNLFWIVVLNFVKIGQTVGEISQFLWFSRWRPIFCTTGFENAYSRPKNWGSGAFHPQNGRQYQRNPQKAHPCASPYRLNHQAWKSVNGSDLYVRSRKKV